MVFFWHFFYDTDLIFYDKDLLFYFDLLYIWFYWNVQIEYFILICVYLYTIVLTFVLLMIVLLLLMNWLIHDRFFSRSMIFTYLFFTSYSFLNQISPFLMCYFNSFYTFTFSWSLILLCLWISKWWFLAHIFIIHLRISIIFLLSYSFLHKNTFLRFLLIWTIKPW